MWPAIIGAVMSLLPMLDQDKQSQVFEGEQNPFGNQPVPPHREMGFERQDPPRLYDFDPYNFQRQAPMLRRQVPMSPSPMMYPYMGR